MIRLVATAYLLTVGLTAFKMFWLLAQDKVDEVLDMYLPLFACEIVGAVLVIVIGAIWYV